MKLKLNASHNKRVDEMFKVEVAKSKNKCSMKLCTRGILKREKYFVIKEAGFKWPVSKKYCIKCAPIMIDYIQDELEGYRAEMLQEMNDCNASSDVI